MAWVVVCMVKVGWLLRRWLFNVCVWDGRLCGVRDCVWWGWLCVRSGWLGLFSVDGCWLIVCGVSVCVYRRRSSAAWRVECGMARRDVCLVACCRHDLATVYFSVCNRVVIIAIKCFRFGGWDLRFTIKLKKTSFSAVSPRGL